MEDLNIDRRIKESLEEAGIESVKSILAASETDFLTSANLSLSDIRQLRLAVSAHAHYPKRVFTLLSHEPSAPRWWGRRLSVGCPVLDLFLRGGIARSGVVELCGGSGSGKTQFCLQVALAAQIPSLQRTSSPLGTIFICTEDPFPSQRLRQLMKIFPERYPEVGGMALGDNIFVEHIADVASLKECLQVRIPHLLRTSPLSFGLIVLDSIAGVFRGSCEYDGNEAKEEQGKSIHSNILSRAKDLKEIGGELHSLSSSHGLSVICVNQVSDAMDNVQGFGLEKKIPALGLSWANMVTTRIMASRSQTYMSLEKNGDGRTLIRELEVIFSPELPPSKCQFAVLQSGVEGIP
ncbi:DNA repair protein XRCC3 [Ischnura elegans]|uniref:DNA repair protein XRCC3 n=1 Tax=Ischnura elegans TaxID=197161 RepID=UPI001ED8AFE9|nr:DNA repair protein XRCC3 [Ischnura elegans]